MCNWMETKAIFFLKCKHFNIARALSKRRREAREVSMNQIIKGFIYYGEEFSLQNSKTMYKERKMVMDMGLKKSGKSNSNYWKWERSHKSIPKRHQGSLLWRVSINLSWLSLYLHGFFLGDSAWQYVGIENADNWSVLKWSFDVRMCQRAIQQTLLTRVVDVKGPGLMSGRQLRRCERSEVFEE